MSRRGFHDRAMAAVIVLLLLLFTVVPMLPGMRVELLHFAIAPVLLAAIFFPFRYVFAAALAVLTIPNDVPDGSDPQFIVGTLAKDFSKNITRQEARYVRITAVNFGKIPAWHPGYGGYAWIFADEIIIE